MYSVDIEADKIYQTKKEKDMLGLQNQEQLFTDAFEYSVLENFANFIGKYVLESLFNKMASLQLY